MGKKDADRARAVARRTKKLTKTEKFRSEKKGFGLSGGKWKRRRGVWVFFKD